MIHDRPQMAPFVSQDDPLWITVSKLYAGELTGFPVKWDSSCPEPKDRYYIGESYDCQIEGKTVGFIRLLKNDGSQLTVDGELLWASLIFEFYNLSERDGFYQIYLDAINGQIDKEQYIERMTKIEHLSLGRALRFYQKIWLPAMKKRGYSTDASLWFLTYKPEYKDWISQFKDKNMYPYDNYGVYFDTKIVPYLKAVSASRQQGKQ